MVSSRRRGGGGKSGGEEWRSRAWFKMSRVAGLYFFFWLGFECAAFKWSFQDGALIERLRGLSDTVLWCVIFPVCRRLGLLCSVIRKCVVFVGSHCDEVRTEIFHR